MKMIRIRPLLVGALAMSLAAAPTHAQLTVYDPTNHAQNVLQAARALSQINNQITSLQNEAQSLLNQARDLASLPTSTLSGIQQSIDRTKQLIGEAQQIAYDVKDIDAAFAKRYPKGSLKDVTKETLVDNAEERWRDAVAAFQDSLKTQAGIVTNLSDTRSQMDTLVGASQDAIGALQAAQAGNQLVALQTRQLADLTAVVAAQGRAAAIAAARSAAEEAQAKEQTRRFIGRPSPYVRHKVELFHE